MNKSNQSDPYLYPAIRPDFLLAVEVLTGTTCVLSILGSSLIILTYVLYKELRTTARQLLVNLSVADWIVAASHFVGIFHYKIFIWQYPGSRSAADDGTDTLCSVQGAFTMFSTIASFLWTISLAGYMLTIIVLRRIRLAKKLVVLFYIVSWGLPLVLTIWFGIEGFFGFIQTSNIVSCYLRNVSNDSHDPRNIYPEVLGYEVWSYLTFIALPLFYITIFCYVRCKRVRSDASSSIIWSWSTGVDMKLILIPLVFLLLRMWSAIVDIVGFFLKGDEATKFFHSEAIAAFVLLAGIGNSAQGLANAILFCVFTRQVRVRLLKTLKSPFLKCCSSNTSSSQPQWEPLSEEGAINGESTTAFEDSSEGMCVEGQSEPLIDVSSANSPRSTMDKSYESTLQKGHNHI